VLSSDWCEAKRYPLSSFFVSCRCRPSSVHHSPVTSKSGGLIRLMWRQNVVRCLSCFLLCFLPMLFSHDSSFGRLCCVEDDLYFWRLTMQTSASYSLPFRPVVVTTRIPLTEL
jgi:hypothetical protein